MNKRRSPDVVPHLAGYHGETEEEGDDAPHVLVVQEVEVVTAQIQEAGH